MITRVQIRMARAALEWGVRELGAHAGVAANTISRYENGGDAMGETLRKLEATLAAAGIIFIDDDDIGGVGVRLKKGPAGG